MFEIFYDIIMKLILGEKTSGAVNVLKYSEIFRSKYNNKLFNFHYRDLGDDTSGKKKICLTYTSHREEIVIASGIDIQRTFCLIALT